MAYTWVTESAFHKDGAHPEGYDYVAAESKLKDIAEAGVGRIYVDSDGNITYESRFHRESA